VAALAIGVMAATAVAQEPAPDNSLGVGNFLRTAQGAVTPADLHHDDAVYPVNGIVTGTRHSGHDHFL